MTVCTFVQCSTEFLIMSSFPFWTKVLLCAICFVLSACCRKFCIFSGKCITHCSINTKVGASRDRWGISNHLITWHCRKRKTDTERYKSLKMIRNAEIMVRVAFNESTLTVCQCFMCVGLHEAVHTTCWWIIRCRLHHEEVHLSVKMKEAVKKWHLFGAKAVWHNAPVPSLAAHITVSWKSHGCELSCLSVFKEDDSCKHLRC